jgi:hypothetical protein
LLPRAEAWRGAEATGIDPDPTMLGPGARREAGVWQRFRKGGLSDLPFPMRVDVATAIPVPSLQRCARHGGSAGI